MKMHNEEGDLDKYTTANDLLLNIMNYIPGGQLPTGGYHWNSTPDGLVHVDNLYKTYSENVTASSLYVISQSYYIKTIDGMTIRARIIGNNFIITVDVNSSYNKPNAVGHDVFLFQLYPDGTLKPMGTPGTYYSDQVNYCDKDSLHAYNGAACTSWALIDQNPENPSESYWKNL